MLSCPSCCGDMRSVIESGIEIDVCDACNSIWLDPGELNQLSRRWNKDRSSNKEVFSLSVDETTVRPHELAELSCPRCACQEFCDIGYRDMQMSRCDGCGGVHIDHENLERMRSASQAVHAADRSKDGSKSTDNSTNMREPSVVTHVVADTVGQGVIEVLAHLLFSI